MRKKNKRKVNKLSLYDFVHLLDYGVPYAIYELGKNGIREQIDFHESLYDFEVIRWNIKNQQLQVTIGTKEVRK